MSMVKTDKLVFEYEKRDEEGNVIGTQRAIDEVDIQIEKGRFIAILGHNGSGKSTFAKHINALLVPGGGTMWVGGRDTKDEDELWNIRQSAGMVFQNPDNQIIATVVEEDVGFGPENLGVPMKEIWQRVDDALEKVGMTEYRYRSPNKLSGGQKQRVAIAGVVAMRPECIVLDEPTAMLDPNGRKEVIRTVRDLQKQEKVTVILITHDLGVVANSADRVVVMYSGKVVETGTCTEIFEKHKHPYTWALLKAAPDMELGSKQKLVAIEGTPPDLILPPKGCPFAERCGHCMKICLETEAPRYTFSKDHSVFCWLYHPESGYTDITFDEGEIE